MLHLILPLKQIDTFLLFILYRHYIFYFVHKVAAYEHN